MLTHLKLFFWQPDDNFQLWSQRLFFSKTFLGFSKMDKNKCPKSEIRNTFG